MNRDNLPTKSSRPIDVAILGGGLTGLALAYFLRERKIHCQIIEARDRLGGRILTSTKEGRAPLEKGATWFGKKHQHLATLLDELGLKSFIQVLGKTAIYEPISTSPHQLVQLPPNTDPSYRVQGGSSTLIEALAAQLQPGQIMLNERVRQIEVGSNDITINTNSRSLRATVVVSTLPPNLLVSSIEIKPSLSDTIRSIAHQTHTWMGESIKVGLHADEPFWRKPPYSGTIFSNVGPIPEMYDHSNFEDTHFTLKGFLNGSYHSLSKEERHELVLNQLRKYFGDDVSRFTSYEELVWCKEEYTHAPHEDHILPHENNGHDQYQAPYLNGKLWIGGSETSQEFPGYMEGAIASAKYLAKKLMQL